MPVPHSFMVKVDMLVNGMLRVGSVVFISITNTDVVLLFTRGAGGAGGSGLPIIGGFLGGPGGNGGNSTLQIAAGQTVHTLTANGGMVKKA